MLVACDVAQPPSFATIRPSARASTPTPRPLPSPTPSPTPLPSAIVDADVRAAVDDDISRLFDGGAGSLDGFWLAAAASLGVSQLPPLSPVATERAESAASACGSGPPRLGSYFRTAEYCAGPSYVAYELEWLYELARDIHPMAPRIVLAHEWAHHIQRALDVPMEGIGAELEADCLAGLYAASLQAHDAAVFDGVTAAVQPLYERGPIAFPESGWFGGNGGSPWQRALAFTTGLFTNDATYCTAYETSDPVDPIDLSGHYVAVPPQASLTTPDEYTTGIEVLGRPYGAVGHFTDQTGIPAELIEVFMSRWRVVDRDLISVEIDYSDLFGDGTTAARFYDRLDPAGTQYAALFTHVQPDGAAIVLEVSAPGSWRQGANADALVDYFSVLVLGVCPKSGSGVVGCPP